MKKPLLAAAALGMLSVASAPSFAQTIDFIETTYTPFTVLSDAPVGTADISYNPWSNNITVDWLAATGPFEAYWGTTTSLDDITELTAGLINSSLTGTADDINYGLFVATTNADFSLNFFTGSSVVSVPDNDWVGLNLDVETVAATEGFGLSDITHYGLYVASADYQTAHASVPEPSTIAILGGGLLAFGYVARRKKAA